MGTFLDYQILFLRKIGLAVLAKAKSKLELIIMPRTL
jgi:hypothetical protein